MKPNPEQDADRAAISGFTEVDDMDTWGGDGFERAQQALTRLKPYEKLFEKEGER